MLFCHQIDVSTPDHVFQSGSEDVHGIFTKANFGYIIQKTAKQGQLGSSSVFMLTNY